MRQHSVNRPVFLYLLLLAVIFMLPLAREADAQSGMSLDVIPPTTEIYAGGSFEVTMQITGARDLYGLEVTCTVDPTVLAWQSSQFGDFFSQSLTGANGVDTDTGTWTGAISQKNPAPALSGDGLYATLTFDALAAGTTTITCDPLAVDRDGGELAIVVNSDPLEVVDRAVIPGAVAGEVIYQGRTEHTGIEVNAVGPTTKRVQTDEQGQFELIDLESGSYTIEATAPMHLSSCATVTLEGADEATLLPVSLTGGDLDESGAIKINDATLVGSNFGLTTTSSPAMNPNADINADGQVNVQDLSILGGNFGKTDCQTWPTGSSDSPDTNLSF